MGPSQAAVCKGQLQAPGDTSLPDAQGQTDPEGHSHPALLPVPSPHSGSLQTPRHRWPLLGHSPHDPRGPAPKHQGPGSSLFHTPRTEAGISPPSLPSPGPCLPQGLLPPACLYHLSLLTLVGPSCDSAGLCTEVLTCLLHAQAHAIWIYIFLMFTFCLPC